MSSEDELRDAHRETLLAWDTNAAYWDDAMGDQGNDFVNWLVWPATQRLLAGLEAGWRVLDVACGNGLYSRRLAALGAEVTAFDFAPQMIERARAYPGDLNASIDYRVLDASDPHALLDLAQGRDPFDAAICQMALFDMAEIETLFQGIAHLLKPNRPFIFSIIHPCFNQPGASMGAELVDRAGRETTIYWVRVTGYLSPAVRRGEALREQPLPQVYFHRPLSAVLNAGFNAGLVLDALEERAFPPDVQTGHNPLSWSGRYSEIPPVLVARMRTPSALKR